jgi:hypothetical protein
MLSTTVEPKCPDTVYRRNVIEAAAGGAPRREATKIFAHATIHPAADRVEAYCATAPANSPAVHRRGC